MKTYKITYKVLLSKDNYTLKAVTCNANSHEEAISKVTKCVKLPVVSSELVINKRIK